jgi:cobalamin biosynthesis protein CobT
MIGYNASDVSSTMGAMRIVARFISEDKRCKIIWNNTGQAFANMKTGEINIPRMTNMDYESLQKLRTFVYHEAGHIVATKVDLKQINKVLHQIWNALEDIRMESVLRNKHEGCKSVFDWACDYFNETNGAKISKGEPTPPLWEALSAMMFSIQNRVPAWVLSDTAKEYFNTAYPTFQKVIHAKDAEDCLKIAKEILELLKQQKQEEGKGESEEQDGEGEQDESKGQDGQGDSKEEQGKSGKGEDGQGQDGEGKSKEGPKEDSKEQDGEGQGESESKDSKNKEDKKPQKGKEGKGKGEESKDTPKPKKVDSADKVTPGNSEYDIHNKGSNAQQQLEKDLGNMDSFIEQMRKEIEESFEYNKEDYIPYTDLDVFKAIEASDADREAIHNTIKGISGLVSGMNRNLEQAIRVMTAVRKNPRQEHGKIDMRRLVDISKSLSTRVFSTKKHGEDLDAVVSILIDESGSMTNYHDVRKMVLAISETLSKLSIPFEVIGATTESLYYNYLLNGFDRSIPMKYKLYKLVTENWNSVKGRLNHTSAESHNVDGEAVQFVANRLLQRREKRKILFSLSDGEPCAGQGKDYKLAQNLTNVCAKYRKAGIEIYGFGLGTKNPEKFYGENNFIFLEKFENIGEEFTKSFAKILTKGKYKA